MAAFIAPAVGALGSIVGGILGNNAQKRASEIQERFGKILAGDTAKTGEISANRTTDIFNSAKQEQRPYADLGLGATQSLRGLLGLGGGDGSLVSEIPLNLPDKLNLQGFKFDPTKAAVDPSMAFRLGEGQKAIERSAAAHGNLLGGGTAKALEQYAQGLGSEEYQNMFNRGLTEYNTGNQAQLQNWQAGVQAALDQFNATNTNRQNIYSRLANTSNMGFNAAGNEAQLATQYGQNMAGQDWQTRMALNNIWSGVANAQSASQVAGGNAWQNALGGITGAVQGGANMMSLSQLLGQQGGGFAPAPVNYSPQMSDNSFAPMPAFQDWGVTPLGG